MSIEERLKKLETINQKIVDSYFIVEQYWQVLEPLLFDERVYSTWDNSEGVVAVKVVRMGLYTSIMIELYASLFDKGNKVGSLYNLIEGVKDSEVKKQLRKRFCAPKGTTIVGDHTEDEIEYLQKMFEKDEISRKEETFDKFYSEVITEYEKLIKSDLVNNLKSVRDKIFAHRELKTIDGVRRFFDPADFDIKYKNAQELIKSIESIVFGVNLLITNSCYEMKGFLKHSKDVAKVFWSKNSNA